MKTRINLFSPEMRPAQPRLTLARGLFGCAAALALLVGLGQWQSLNNQRLQQQLDLAYEQQSELGDELARLSTELASHRPDEQLLTAVAQAKARIDGLARLSQLLDQDELLIQPGFSNLMRDLSNSADRQVWLQQFDVAQAQLRLAGQAQRAAAVPAWIDRLGQQPSLAGRALSRLAIDGDGDGPVRFEASHGLSDNKEAR
ncbi:PilN domain-containing protein [Ferrimonas marina]|uniref:Fimbrial assembly protein (PilN) n=1 Tax=Ferrimonas marina TaxID=299255 RepID=A0A1M5Y095_9GAMM|nr:PilN domain-containing protein [Ferrimonas marina]SHI05477.1 Fimbrial assembly protein (PilN) [Ferrimonas marina]